ncbi:MAG: hypothetical protein OEM85_00200 [Gammaproteobacteria bacterium]|nr:hypothetical protein [Gammaproteobacteria bacterium]
MNFAREFENYIAGFRERLRMLATARGVALLAITALVVTVIAVLVMGRLGFPSGLMIAARILLAASLGCVAWQFLLQPRRALETDACEHIEARAPDFNGRVTTFARARQSGNALVELLAEDSLVIANDNPATGRVPQKELAWTWTVAGACASVLLLLAIASPGNFAYGVRDLWLGWAFPGLLPPQSIVVTPGDSGIRLGGNLRIEAAPQGFASDDAEISVRFAGGEWQPVDMTGAGEVFEFTFYSVRQNLEYFVSAGSVRSPSYSVQVVDVPVVEKLTHRYEYPEWAGRAPDEADPGGDIRKIAETRVEVRIETDRALPAGDLIVNDEAIPLNTDGMYARAEFEIETDGQYFIAARVGGGHIRLTDDYFIRVEEDHPPEIEFERPGRDWSASRIEEVTARIKAQDDLRLESLSLHYSVNGAGWKEVELDASNTDVPLEHIFYLESLSTEAMPLAPGDLVSYYAVASDRDKEARTDIFFIDVQPFDRRFSQSQSAASGAPGQQGQQNEVSQRQREIIISTWNLIRERGAGQRGEDAYIRDNAALLARLQGTLRMQVETLAQRAEARQLTVQSEEIERFVRHLQAAGEAMSPAAEQLAAIEFEAALLKEQEALQHLLAAEAVFTDIDVTLQANNRAAGGGQAGRDLAEMFDLEMDLEKNQYETGSRATPEAPDEQMEQVANELEELARRQQQLARNQQQTRTPLPEQRWQQEQLRREAEALRRRLEELSHGSQSQSAQASNRQSAQQSGQSSSRQAGDQAGERQDAEGRRSQQVADLQRRLQSALRAMGEENAEEAGNQLQGARDSAAAARLEAVQARFNDLAERAGELHETQAGVEERLQEAMRRVLDAEQSGQRRLEPLYSGLDRDEEYEIAEQKRQMLTDLQALQQSARGAAHAIDEAQPEIAADIQEAIGAVQEQDIETRIAVAAAYIEQGGAVYVVSSESAVTENLRNLSRALQQVAREVGDMRGIDEPSDLARALGNARALRRELQENPGGTPGSLQEEAQGLARDVGAALRTQQGARLGGNYSTNLRRLADELRIAGGGRDPAAVAQNMARTLAVVEQLELELDRALNDREAGVRTHLEDEVPEAYKEVVADYYRKLGRVNSATDNAVTP